MSELEIMVKEAREIEKLVNSTYCSDKQLLSMSESFYIKYGRSWTSCLGH